MSYSFALVTWRALQRRCLTAHRHVPPISEVPRPLRLSNQDEQAEFDSLIRQRYEEMEASPSTENPSASITGTHEGLNAITGEIDGPRGPEPTRYDDWNFKGRVTDF